MNNTLTDNRPSSNREQNLEPRRHSWLLPQVNIVETKDVYLLEAEMPGVNKDGLEISLEGNELTIIGHRNPDLENAQLVYRESTSSDFRRAFELDPTIDTSKIKAKMDNGILYLELPKAEKVKPRKIAVE
jgi:HSP20 family protein